ncbi:MAG: acyl carrier protein [Christensenellales bacterium]|jgi:acyl carrier protein
MTRKDVQNQLQDIFRNLFDDDNIVISNETTAADIEDWDSLEHINLINMIERHFNIKLEMKEVVNFKNVGDMIECIAAKTS